MELSGFLKGTKKKLVSSMYEFHAAHIADAIEDRLEKKVDFKLVVAVNSRDSDAGPADGDFNRAERFAQWEDDFTDRFDRVFVPIGSSGLVATSYHIKVSVRDKDFVWLSSGNWKRTSQPKDGKGNREWHVIVQNETLANRFRNHILADFEQSRVLGGTLSSPRWSSSWTCRWSCGRRWSWKPRYSRSRPWRSPRGKSA